MRYGIRGGVARRHPGDTDAASRLHLCRVRSPIRAAGTRHVPHPRTVSGVPQHQGRSQVVGVRRGCGYVGPEPGASGTVWQLWQPGWSGFLCSRSVTAKTMDSYSVRLEASSVVNTRHTVKPPRAV